MFQNPWPSKNNLAKIAKVGWILAVGRKPQINNGNHYFSTIDDQIQIENLKISTWKNGKNKKKRIKRFQRKGAILNYTITAQNCLKFGFLNSLLDWPNWATSHNNFGCGSFQLSGNLVPDNQFSGCVFGEGDLWGKWPSGLCSSH